MEYLSPIKEYKFGSSELNAPHWITLDTGKEFRIYVCNDDDLSGYIFFVLVFPEKEDPDEGGTYMQPFYSRFFQRPAQENYSIPEEEFDFEQFSNRVHFEIKSLEDPRKKRFIDYLGIYMRIEGTSYYGCAPINDDGDLFHFDRNEYLKCAKDESECKNEKFVEGKMEKLDELEINITQDHQR